MDKGQYTETEIYSILEVPLMLVMVYNGMEDSVEDRGKDIVGCR